MNNFNNIICFSSNTEILTEDGKKYISQIKPNDVVISYNSKIGATENIIVERVANSRHSIINRITFENNNLIECTVDHPLWIIEKDWCSINPKSTNENYKLNVNQIEVGDRCLFYNNFGFSEVEIKQIDFLSGDFRMHIFSGGKNHCFFANGILVHDENLQDLNLKREYIEFSDRKPSENLLMVE